MPFELSLMWGIHALLALFTLGVLFALSRSRYRRALVYRFSHTIELPLVSDEIAAAAERRILHRTAAMMAGGLLGILASAVVVYLDPASASAPTIWLVTLPLTLSGMCAGAAIVALRESLFRRHPDAVRVARAITVTLHDYISPRRLRMPCALLLVAAGLCLAGSVLGLTGLIDGSTFILSAALPTLAAALVVTIAGTCDGSRQLIRSPETRSRRPARRSAPRTPRRRDRQEDDPDPARIQLENGGNGRYYADRSSDGENQRTDSGC